jgi:hypothetical protein
VMRMEVEHWKDFFGILSRKSYQTPNAVRLFYGSQNVGAKLHVREGINPDRNLRSLNIPVLLELGSFSSENDPGTLSAIKGGGNSSTTRRLA